MMREYYRGSIRHHASFWIAYRALPVLRRYGAFLKFYKQVEQEVEQGKCSLRDAGYALRPIFYDEEVYRSHEFDLTFMQDAVEDLIIEAVDNQKAAEQTWDYIVRFMDDLAK
jgi:hypothetical protein